MFKKFFIVATIAGSILLASGCSKNNADEENQTKATVSVSTIPVRTQTMNNTVNLLGNINGNQEVRVFSKIPDRITKFEVDMGDPVREGSLIAVIENSTIEAQVNQVKANLEQARAQLANLKTEYKRMEQLYKQNAVSQQQYDGTKTQMEATRAQVKALQEGLKQAQNQLDESYIRSPINGVIGQRFLNVGDMAAGQMPVVTIVQMDTVKILVNVIEKYASDLKLGLPAKITIASLKDTSFTGSISKISPVIDPQSRMILTEIKVPNPERKLRPGMFADVQIILESHPNAMVVPQYAILQKTQLHITPTGEQEIVRQDHVYLVRNDSAYYRAIQTGFQEGNMTEVVSGLKMGDQIVILGQNNLQDSTKVRIVKESEEQI